MKLPIASLVIFLISAIVGFLIAFVWPFAPFVLFLITAAAWFLIGRRGRWKVLGNVAAGLVIAMLLVVAIQFRAP